MDQSRIQIIALKGYSNSGKTTVLEKLVMFLDKNQRNAAVVKHIHRENFTIDQPGKDTWRLRKAGGNPIVSYSDNEITFMTDCKLNLEKTISIIQQIHSNLDYIFLEGFWQNMYPKIIFLREINDLERLLVEFSKNLECDKIITSIFCISGNFLTQSSFSHKYYVETLENLYKRSIITESQRKHLESITLLNIMQSPEKLLKIYNELEFNFRK